MRTAIAVLGLGIVAAVAGAAGAASEANRIRVSTSLNAAQEVPRPTGATGARGTFAATLTKASGGATLAWRLTFRGLSGAATAAHIHTARRGQAGPVAVPLCGPCTSGASGRASVDADLVTALQNGGAYVNVHTDRNPAGEIRGQLGVVASVRQALVTGQEVPKPSGNVGRARGLFTGTVTKSGSTATLAWRLTFSGLTGRATAAHIHTGARGRSGPVAVPLCGPCRSGQRKTTRLSASLLRELEAGRAYVNVHTARNPAGEIRGQLPKLALSMAAGSSATPPPDTGGDYPYP